MPLNKIEQIKFDTLCQTLKTLLDHNTPLETAKSILANQISDFENESNNKVNYKGEGDETTLIITDLSKDFIRTREPNEESQVLRAKIEGIGIDVKIFKKDTYQFENTQVVSALRALANEVEGLETELTQLGSSDVRKDVNHITEGLSDNKENQENELSEQQKSNTD